MVHPPQLEQQFGLLVESGSDAVEGRRDVLADAGVIGTATAHRDFLGPREQPAVGSSQPLHHPVAELALQQVEQGIDLLRAVLQDRLPDRGRQRLDLDLDPIRFRTRHERADFPRFDHQVGDGPVPQICPSARQAIGEILITLQILTPLQSPEGLGDLGAGHRHRTGLPLLLRREFLGGRGSQGNLATNGDIGCPETIAAIVKSSHQLLPQR